GWAWAASASIFGAALGAVFVLTGSLAGPLLAHFAVDALALFVASQSQPSDRPVEMNGLLGAVRASKRGS
ncbi:MAG: CPBP family intramembrane glutamic endopeptidase, partial [Polyangiaceae bacterium]